MLHLLEADTWTLDFMESLPQTFPMADFDIVKERLLKDISQDGRAHQLSQLIGQHNMINSGGFISCKQLHVRSKPSH